MKEAAGEANMTVITIVLIGIVLVAGTAIVRNMMDSTSSRTDCINGGGTWENGRCNTSGTDGGSSNS